MKFGNIRFDLNGLAGITKSEFMKLYKEKAHRFQPYTIDEVWSELRPLIPKKKKEE